MNIKNIFKILLTNCALAVPVPLLKWAFDPHTPLKQVEWTSLYSLIYANCIGFIMFVITPPLWERSCRVGFVFRWISRGLGILSGTAVGCLLAALTVFSLSGGTDSFWDEFRSSFTIALLLTIAVVAYMVTYETYRGRLEITAAQLKTEELARERAQKAAAEARLASLESRVHPHFLFNTINSISSLIPEDPRRAERLLTQMAGLLRFSLDSAQAGFVSLEQEIKIVRDYLEIEEARFGDRLRYAVEIPEPFLSALVPPLSLQTLVENSIKYAVSPTRRGAMVRVSAEVQDESIFLQVADDGPGFDHMQLPAGHGLDNLQERLKASLGDAANLVIESGSDGSSVGFRLPLSAQVRASPQSDAVLVRA